jgi:hypothetical protein
MLTHNLRLPVHTKFFDDNLSDNLHAKKFEFVSLWDSVIFWNVNLENIFFNM